LEGLAGRVRVAVQAILLSGFVLSSAAGIPEATFASQAVDPAPVAGNPGLLPSPGNPAPFPIIGDPAPVRSHDWRSPGLVSAVGGRVYDPRCVPLNSAGANIPNLLYHYPLSPAASTADIDATLSWLNAQHFRWLRVFVTGHGLPPADPRDPTGTARAPGSSAVAVAGLHLLLERTQVFNAAHTSDEAIYVLVALTDYYPAGVPGDRYAYDNPVYRGSPVLPAQWYRAGITSFEFEQEHAFGRLLNLPNYEVFFRDWVQAIVTPFASHPAIMGWQIGNELKARSSGRHGITTGQAYDWYLDFTTDIVDTIRGVDRNHIIFTGAQYIAELVDWEYRPHDMLVPALVPHYRSLVQRSLDACGRYCWNVWGLTSYDFNLYALDDATLMSQAGVASVFTEYGFTRGTPEEMEKHFGQDLIGAVRRGLGRPWITVDGGTSPYLHSAADLVLSGLSAGISPWGAPAPGPSAAYDADYLRGITVTPEQTALWTAWRETAERLEAANRASGPTTACFATRTA
jgi:hypothetical protein